MTWNHTNPSTWRSEDTTWIIRGPLVDRLYWVFRGQRHLGSFRTPKDAKDYAENHG